MPKPSTEFLKILESIIVKPLKIEKKGSTFYLEETGSDAKCKKANFRNQYSRRLSIYKFDVKLPSNCNLFPFFVYNYPFLNCMVDYIIFFPKDDNLIYTILCNLKSDNKGNNGKQIKAATIFVNFLIEHVSRYLKNHVTCQIRKVLFCTFREDKGTTQSYKNTNNSDLKIFNCMKDVCDLEDL